jgi:hypothetical protein
MLICITLVLTGTMIARAVNTLAYEIKMSGPCPNAWIDSRGEWKCNSERHPQSIVEIGKQHSRFEMWSTDSRNGIPVNIAELCDEEYAQKDLSLFKASQHTWSHTSPIYWTYKTKEINCPKDQTNLVLTKDEERRAFMEWSLSQPQNSE